MDPIGFGFENFDAVGRYRKIDNGASIDTSGEVFHTADIDGKFIGVAELGKKLATGIDLKGAKAPAGHGAAGLASLIEYVAKHR